MADDMIRQEFHEETDRIKEQLTNHELRINSLEISMKGFNDLPSAINSLDKTMALMRQNLEILNAKVDSIMQKEEEIISKDKEQDEAILSLDNKSKVDLVGFLKDNWWGIVMSAITIWLLVNKYLVK